MTTVLLSEHLSEVEYLATSHREYLDAQERAWCANPQLARNAQRLAREAFEPVREELAEPLHVTSGFRCEALNAAVGGKATSLHLQALAVDVVPWTLDPRAALFVLLHAMRRGKLPHLDMVIVERGRWLHLQVAREGAPSRQLALESADGQTFVRVA